MVKPRNSAAYSNPNFGTPNMRTPTRLAGFTLIEMLMTISLFSLVMGVLATGLFVGTKGWNQADTLLMRAAQVHTALRKQIQDLENLYVDQENPPPNIVYTNEDPTATSLEFICVNSNTNSKYPVSLIHVIWKTKKSGNSVSWIREREFLVADKTTEPV